MITKPTVFVIGAGASAPFNYPTGEKLKQTIIDDVLRSGRMRDILFYQAYGDRDIIAFRKAFMRSSQASIDAFLEHQPQWMEMGKLAITVALAEKENIEEMFKIGNWYGHLFRALDNGFEDFNKNKLSVITFNYDRSLETYLFNALKYSYNKSDDKVAEVLSSIPVVHLHGQVGKLPWQDPRNYRPYGEISNNYMLKLSSEGIKIIHEADVEKSDAFKEAKELLINAEQIYFLGFGYHNENIRRLGLLEMDTKLKTIYGTALRMTNREVTDTMAKVNDKIDLRQQGAQNFQVLEFMRENISLF